MRYSDTLAKSLLVTFLLLLMASFMQAEPFSSLQPYTSTHTCPDHEGHDPEEKEKDHDDGEPEEQEQWTSQIMSFYTDKAPGFIDELMRLKKEQKEDAEEFWDEMITIYKHYLEELEDNEDQAQKFLSYERIELRSRLIGNQIRVLHEQNRKTPTPQRAAKIKSLQAELRELLSSIFDQRSSMIEEEARMLEAEAKRLKTLLEARSKNRQSMIEKRLNMLSGSDEELEW